MFSKYDILCTVDVTQQNIRRQWFTFTLCDKIRHSVTGKGLIVYIKNYCRLEIKIFPYKYIKSNSYFSSQ